MRIEADCHDPRYPDLIVGCVDARDRPRAVVVIGAEQGADTATSGPLYENGIASAPAVPTNNKAQRSAAKTSTCVFMLALSAEGQKS